MKILFIMKYPLVDQYSIMQKLNGEINAVRNLGNDAFYISFDREYMYLDNGTQREKIKKLHLGHFPGYFHTFVFYDIYRAAKRIIHEKKYDLIYFRYSPLNFFGNRMMRKASQKSKLIIEIPSYPPENGKTKKIARKLYFIYSRKMWRASAKYVTLFAGIGENAESYLGRPFLNIDNGIDISLITPRTQENTDGKIHLLAVASMCEWHGYERIIEGLARWNSSKAHEYIIDLVGNEGDGSLEKWQSLAKKYGIEEQVIFHGRKTGDALTKMYNLATIGISSLALYKVGFKSGSVLKLREYMARGLPFIYAHDDPHMSADFPWCLKIPNDDSAVDMECVDAFVERVKKEERLSEKMREYARTNMTWEKQFQKIFSKVESM